MGEGEILLALGQPDEAGEVGVEDCGQAASGSGHGVTASRRRKGSRFKTEAGQTVQ
jgi:hypothetical protein